MCVRSACRIAQCFAFLVCTKWSNPVIHRDSRVREPGSSSSTNTRYAVSNSGLLDFPEDERHLDELICGLQDIGGHLMKIPLITFQVVLCMHLEVTHKTFSPNNVCVWDITQIIKTCWLVTFRGLLKLLSIYLSRSCFLHSSYCKSLVFYLLLLN